MTLLSPAEIAVRYGFSASQIRRMIRQGLIKAEKVGSFYAVREKDIKNIKRKRTKKCKSLKEAL